MSSSKRSRRHFTAEQKVAILKRHMVDKVPVSDLCDELGLQPSVFYQWQRQVLENLAGASRRQPTTVPEAGEGAPGQGQRAGGQARQEGQRDRRGHGGAGGDKKEL